MEHSNTSRSLSVMGSDRMRWQLLGGAIGLVAPFVALYVFYQWNFPHLEFRLFIRRMLFSNLFAPLLSLCILTNLLAFFGFIWTNRDDGSRGVLLATFLYGFVVLYLKIF